MKMLSARVRDEGFRVVLTGEGADEAFGGYDIFKENKIRRFWSRNPQSPLRPRLLERLYPYLNGTTSSATAYLKAFYGCALDDPGLEWFSHVPRWQTTAQLHNFLSEPLRRSVRSVESAIAPYLTQLKGQHWFNRAEYLEAKILLPRYLLSSQGDRMLMANGVEGRYPYLDHNVVERALELDPRLKMRVLEEKHALKKAVGRYLPASVVRRNKQPYRAPDIAGLVNPAPPDYMRELMSEEVVARYGYFDPKKVGLLFRKAVSGRAVGNRDNMAFVGILSTQILHYLFIENFDRWFMFRSEDDRPERVTTGV
jgi:asparagine synthase (glutamine-hydrolysing)